MENVIVIGAGLAGCEAAWAIANEGIKVTLYDMKPDKKSPAHHKDGICELVCSNSLKADRPESAAGLLKMEMEVLGSLLVPCARKTAVAAGGALAVDRNLFSAEVEKKIRNHENINFVEILYTNYFWLNYKYKNLWLIHFKANKEAIAHYDVPRGIASVIGQTKHTLNQNPRSGKKIGNSYRLLWFLQKYAAGAPYKEALVLDEEKRNRIKELKSIEELENEDLKNILYNALEANELIYKTLPKADDEKKKAIEDELRYAITTAIMINENRFFEKQGVVKNAKESYFGR